MYEALKCLPVNQGILCLIDSGAIKKIGNIRVEDVSIEVRRYGISAIIREQIAIRIPETLLDYIVENRNISLYTFSPDRYIEEAVATIELSRDSIIKAKSVYEFSNDGVTK